MKQISQYLERLKQAEAETIASCGEARRVKTLDCKYELRGGSPEDRALLRLWISMFMHNVVAREV